MVDVEPGPLTLTGFLTSVPSAVPLAAEAYDALVAVVEPLGPATARVSRTQVALRRRTGFCWLWLPAMHLRRPAAEVVVSVALAREDPSPRWKQVVRVSGRRWMHHLEVTAAADLDDEVAAWVAEAYDLAG